MRRAFLRPLRSVELERSSSLDMEEECPMALTKEWANVSSEEQTSFSIEVIWSWELAALVARAALLSRGWVPVAAELPGARRPRRSRRGGWLPKSAELQGACRPSRDSFSADITLEDVEEGEVRWTSL